MEPERVLDKALVSESWHAAQHLSFMLSALLFWWSINKASSKDSPSRKVVDDVASGTIDVAVVWGPLAGYFASKPKGVLTLQPVQPSIDGALLPMSFLISMGVRKQDIELRQELNDALRARRREIAVVLEQYHVPLAPVPSNAGITADVTGLVPPSRYY